MTWLNDRQRNDLDNYDPEGVNADIRRQLANQFPWRKAAFDHEREIAWSQLGWVQHERARKEIRRQKIENVCKWITLVACVVMAVVLFLVWLRP